MTTEEMDALKDILGSLKHLAEVARGSAQPTRAILETGFFIVVQKVRFLLGERDE